MHRPPLLVGHNPPLLVGHNPPLLVGHNPPLHPGGHSHHHLLHLARPRRFPCEMIKRFGNVKLGNQIFYLQFFRSGVEEACSILWESIWILANDFARILILLHLRQCGTRFILWESTWILTDAHPGISVTWGHSRASNNCNMALEWKQLRNSGVKTIVSRRKWRIGVRENSHKSAGAWWESCDNWFFLNFDTLSPDGYGKSNCWLLGQVKN